MKISALNTNKRKGFLLTLYIFFFFTINLSALSSNPVYYTPSQDYHIVRKGETLHSISNKYSLPVERIKLFNNLRSDRIFVGQKIYLYPKPAGKHEFVTVRKIPKTGYHLVRQKESIHRIAKMYDLSVFDILDFNDLNTFSLKAGMKLWLISREPKTVTQESKKITKPLAIDMEIKKEIKKPGQKIIHTKKDLFIPANGTVTSEFGIRNGRPHKGIDIAGSVGDPIYAALNGKVAYVGTQRGYGNVVILEHDNYIMTVYAHNETNLVRLGETVKRGQPIATLGKTGTTTGPHLHFEYRIKGKAINPREVLPEL